MLYEVSKVLVNTLNNEGKRKYWSSYWSLKWASYIHGSVQYQGPVDKMLCNGLLEIISSYICTRDCESNLKPDIFELLSTQPNKSFKLIFVGVLFIGNA